MRPLRNLACSRDWNEHLTPQTDFFPKALRESAVIAPVERIAHVLPVAATVAGISADTAKSFVADDAERPRRLAPEQWPRGRFTNADKDQL